MVSARPFRPTHEDEQQNAGLDAALNNALSKMQKKLDASVLNRMTSLEQRLVQRLSSLDLRLGEGGTGRSEL